jgi:hypothetical protein
VQAFRRVHGKNMSSLVYQTGTGDYWQCKAAFDAFFSGDGASLPNSGQLRHRADRRLAERAFWSAMAHCWRGNREVAWELLRYTWRLSPMTLLLPPVGHLLRTKDLHRKLQLVLSERRARA